MSEVLPWAPRLFVCAHHAVVPAPGVHAHSLCATYRHGARAGSQAEVAHLDLTGYNPALIASYLARNNEGPGGLQDHDAVVGGPVGDKEDMDLQYDILLHQEKEDKGGK